MKREILIVDDEEPFRRRVKRALQGRDFLFREAGSVAEAVTLLDAHPGIQVILLDLEFKADRMIDGTMVLEHIKNRASSYEVIVLTGHEEYLAAEKAWAYGVHSYMPKGKDSNDESLIYEVERAFWALERKLLIDKLRWKVNQLQALTQVARRISSDSEADIDKMLSLIVTNTAEVMSAEVCMLFLRDEKEGVMVLRECYGMPMIEGAHYGLGEGGIGTVALTGESKLESPAERNPGKYDEEIIRQLRPNKSGLRSINAFMAVPIIALERNTNIKQSSGDSDRRLTALVAQPGLGEKADGPVRAVHKSLSDSEGEFKGKIIGVLKVINKKHHSLLFDQDDLSIFETFASQIGIALALAERHTALSHLVRGVGHEIRNKAGMIPPNIMMIKEDLARETGLSHKDKIIAKLDRVEKTAYQALDFARELLGFSDSHFQLREDLNINELVKEAIAQLLSISTSIKNADNVRLVNNYCDEPLFCSVYRTPFIHIIQNIVMNAYEAMEDLDQGTLTISTGADNTGRIAFITLTDCGKGIRDEDIPKIFNATFFRRKGGNGLGLWLVKNYLSQMDGMISVKSQLNQRTAFTLQLPMVSTES